MEYLVLLGVLKRSNNLEWGYPYFSQPKPKINRVCFLSDFRNLIKQLKNKPYSMPNTNVTLLILGGFQYAIL